MNFSELQIKKLEFTVNLPFSHPLPVPDTGMNSCSENSPKKPEKSQK
ncbi:MAG TPA: hypothetical protein GX523_07905 [Desulfitobacterium dehalogenans]|uniref:Uncharacterized protein n=1 Tax=Desulfitobacterium dehalogenans TaxID=36854 RepID=A0A7C7D5D3_9FIRM|nr:hypothetical protein [Desulfitobacterium dehalogenans]